jgi:hypothetical protein
MPKNVTINTNLTTNYITYSADDYERCANKYEWDFKNNIKHYLLYKNKTKNDTRTGVTFINTVFNHNSNQDIRNNNNTHRIGFNNY